MRARPKQNTKTKGDLTEAMVMAALLKAGKRVLLPFGEDHRYDMVVDENGVFTRIQCKTGRIRADTVRFNSCSVHHHRSSKRRSYKGQVDLFGVYVPESGRVYLVPVEDVANTEGCLRLKPWGKDPRLAERYELLPVK